MIQPFSKKEADNLSSYKGFVNGKDMTFGEFIEHSIKNKEVSNKFYFGKLSNELADRIEKEVGKNVRDYIVVINSTEIRHILSEHDDTVTKGIMIKLPDVFDAPDDILKLSTLDYGGRTAFTLHKKINGYAIVVNGVSDGRKAIQIDSFWLTKKDTPLVKVFKK